MTVSLSTTCLSLSYAQQATCTIEVETRAGLLAYYSLLPCSSNVGFADQCGSGSDSHFVGQGSQPLSRSFVSFVHCLDDSLFDVLDQVFHASYEALLYGSVGVVIQP